MFLSNISIHLCMIIHYITEGNIFVDIISKLLEQQKNCNVIINIALKLMVNKLDYIRFKKYHCVKNAQMQSYFWPVFSCIQSEYSEIRTRNNSIFRHFSRSVWKESKIKIHDLVPEDNGKQKNPNEFYTKKYQKHVACSDGNKLVCFDDKFSKPV